MEYKDDEADTVLISPEEQAQYLHQPTRTTSKRRVLIYAVLITVACIIAAVVVAVATVLKKPFHRSPTVHTIPTPTTTPPAQLQPAHANVDGLGELRGYASELKGASKVAMFLGIPYGKAPVKERRWRNPEPFGSSFAIVFKYQLRLCI